MRHPKHFLGLGLKRVLYGFTFLLAMLAILLSIGTLSNLPVQSSLFSANTFGIYKSAGDDRVEGGAVEMLDPLISKLAEEIKRIGELTGAPVGNLSELNRDRLNHTSFLTEILRLAVSVKDSLPDVRGNAHEEGASTATARPSLKGYQAHDELAEYFLVEEIRKYMRTKPNRLGKQNFMGANGTFTSIGHACFAMKEDLEKYMDYDVGDLCKDDWKEAQRLMVHGCDPLPRRRCYATAPKYYTQPYPINESIWKLPDDRNVRWNPYRCKNFTCLAMNGTRKGFFKCSDCFNLTHHEMPRWMEIIYPDPAVNLTADFLIEEVLQIQPGLIRIGLDFSVGTGTFAARMREFNVTIVSATINLGAPFNEMISLRGLVPLYLSINQRLPFFDNTLDIIHTTRFLDGWIDLVLLDFVLYDWDRVLRPGGLLWIDSFFCLKDDLKDYLEAFNLQRYKKHKWVVVPKTDKNGEEVFFSAVLEKPPRPF